MHCLNLPEGVTKDLTKEVTFAQSLKGLGVSQVKSRWGGQYFYQRENVCTIHAHYEKTVCSSERKGFNATSLGQETSHSLQCSILPSDVHFIT